MLISQNKAQIEKLTKDLQEDQAEIKRLESINKKNSDKLIEEEKQVKELRSKVYVVEKDLRDTKKENSQLMFEKNKLSNERNEAVEQKELTIASMNSLV